ncbi:MAG TPA: ATP-binding protein [Caulobacteraceae bacterium]|nr:ATP-binding protein [Caulobacteraceae bacterium]
MATKPAPDAASPTLDHAPFPLATVEGESHIVRYVNPAFCLLIDKASDDILGKPFSELLPADDECLALLDHVYRTGGAAIHKGLEPVGQRPVVPFYTMWPVTADQRPVGVMIQVIQAQSLNDKTLAMNEALLLGSLRQHELTEAADRSNTRLRTELGQRIQSEADALMLTKEISHRIKNNLQIVVALIANEIRRLPSGLAQGYVAMQARIGAIGKLYDLISRSGRVESVQLDAYLREIATNMSVGVLEPSSGIRIEVKSEPVDLDADRAVPFGLLVNELVTNAVKHAFPGGSGRIVMSVERAGDQIELVVADDGVGMPAEGPASGTGKHGSDYVAIFVRQLAGQIEVSGSDDPGTTFTVRFPATVH